MFGAKVKEKTEIYNHPQSIYHISKSVNLVMKLSGLFPVKIEETETGLKPVICKFGVFCTLFHLLVYLISVIHFVFLSNAKISLNYGKIADYGYIAILVLQGLTTLILFAGVFHMIKFQTYIIKYVSQLEIACFQLNINNKAIIHKSRYLIGFFIAFLIFLYILGATIFIHTQYVSMLGLPPIDLIIIGILPNIYLYIYVTYICIYVLAMHVCNSEFLKFMKIFLNEL